MATTTKARDVTAEIAFLTRALKAPTMREAVDRLADRARAESWTHEEFLAAVLGREVAAREAHGGEGRIRAARFPARKSLEEFDYDHARGLRREQIAHLGTLDFIAGRENVVLIGPPGTGKTHCETRGEGPMGLLGAEVPESVSVIATDSKDSLTRQHRRRCPGIGSVVVVAGTGLAHHRWPDQKPGRPQRVVPHHSPATR